MVNRLSIVITNYNYERYVGSAIDSALALDWPDVEVVVVDDGSTDDSLEVVRSYGDRITVLDGPNGGQRVAANRGFAESTGDVVVFLDSDDVLPPELPRRLDESMTTGVSKVQFRMQRIDADGRAFGPVFPEWRPVPTPQALRRWVESTSAYPTPPGSGNAYARWFLSRIFPLDASIGDSADSGCLAAAPLHGHVLTVPDVVVSYRQHGRNDSNLLAEPGRFVREIERARARWRFGQISIGVSDSAIDEAPLFRSLELLQFRVAAARLTPSAHPLVSDSRGRMLLDAVRNSVRPGGMPWRRRLAVGGWCAAVLVVPGFVAPRLVAARWRQM